MRFSLFTRQNHKRIHHEIDVETFEALFVAAEIDAGRDNLGVCLIFNDRMDVRQIASVHVKSDRRPFERGTVCTQWIDL